MNRLNEIKKEETREMNGGDRYYCKVCGKQSNSQWSIFSHVATRHIGAWTNNLYNLVTSIF